MKIHKDSRHKGIRFPCDLCGYKATGKSSLKRHMARKHEGKKISCSYCDYTCGTRGYLKKHIRLEHNGSPTKPEIKPGRAESFLQNPGLRFLFISLFLLFVHFTFVCFFSVSLFSVYSILIKPNLTQLTIHISFRSWKRAAGSGPPITVLLRPVCLLQPSEIPPKRAQEGHA